MSGIQIIGMGRAVPSVTVTNDDFVAVMDTSDEWIRTRTGIRERHYCGEGESLQTLAIEAARKALASASVTPEQVGLIITATISADYQMPSTSCLVQEALQIPGGIPAFDISAACTGFVYGMQVANALIQAGNACTEDGQVALVIGAEQLSKVIDFSDRSTCVLFGDGAAAAVVRPSEKNHFYSHTAAAGEKESLYLRVLGRNQVDSDARLPFGVTYAEESQELMNDGFLHMDGQKVFRFAVKALGEEIETLETLSGKSVEDVDFVVCHQANERIIDHVRKKKHIPEEKMFKNLAGYGNTSGASIPLALCELWEQGELKPGTRLFAIGFGAGLTWGGFYMEL